MVGLTLQADGLKISEFNIISPARPGKIKLVLCEAAFVAKMNRIIGGQRADDRGPVRKSG